MKKYVVGYERDGKFVVLYEYESVYVALSMVKALKAKGKGNVKIKKRY